MHRPFSEQRKLYEALGWKLGKAAMIAVAERVVKIRLDIDGIAVDGCSMDEAPSFTFLILLMSYARDNDLQKKLLLKLDDVKDFFNDLNGREHFNTGPIEVAIADTKAEFQIFLEEHQATDAQLESAAEEAINKRNPERYIVIGDKKPPCQ